MKIYLSQREIESISSQYALGDIVEIQQTTSGTVQANYVLVTTQGRFVLRYYQNRSVGSVLFESELIDYLTNKQYPCPAIVPMKNGEHIGVYNEKPYALFEFIVGEHVEQPHEGQRKQLLQKIAELHTLTRGYQPLHTSERWNYSVELCLDLAQQAARKRGGGQAQEKLAWLEEALSELSLPKSLPKGICHCDFHFSNVLFKDGEFRALIDFDDANFTFLLYDLAALMNPFRASFDWNTWFDWREDEDVFDFGEASRIVGEYNRYRVMSSDEKWHLFDVYKLSILFDSVWYFERWVGTDFYERRKIAYLDRLGRGGFMRRFLGNYE